MSRLRTSDAMTIVSYCDFGHCAPSCWRRCDIPGGRWDGSPTHWYREVWKALRRMPRQQSLELEHPREAA